VKASRRDRLILFFVVLMWLLAAMGWGLYEYGVPFLLGIFVASWGERIVRWTARVLELEDGP